MGLFELSERVRASCRLAWGLTLLAFILALAARFMFNHALPPGFPYLTFFPAVILTAFFGGIWPGIACAIGSGFAAWYWFIPPFGTFALNQSVVIALGFYVCIVSVDIALIHFMQAAVQRLREERAISSGLYDQQRAMFQELQHRVANNMQFVSSLLGLQKRKVAQEHPVAAKAFDEARARLDTISRIHRRLYDPETLDQPVRHYLQDLCNDLIETSNGPVVTCKVSAPETRLDIRHLTTLSMIIVEAVTNALKHAFKGRERGTITVNLELIDNSRYRLVIADDGVGFDAGTNPASSKSLGQRIMYSLAQQLHAGDIRYIKDNGTRMELEFRR